MTTVPILVPIYASFSFSIATTYKTTDLLHFICVAVLKRLLLQIKYTETIDVIHCFRVRVTHRVKVRILPSVRVRWGLWLGLRPRRHIERFFNALEYIRRDNQIQAYELLQNEF